MDDDKTIAALRELGTTTVSDAMDRLGIAGQCLGVMPLDRSFRLCGRAFTVHYIVVDNKPGTVGDYIDDVGPGQVVVLDNHGRLDGTMWGDLLTSMADRRGIEGTVIDGICRDVSRSIELRYAIFARGNWMRTGKDRVRLDKINVPVTIGGAAVNPGDYMLGDADGVVAIPAERMADVAAAASEIAGAEEKIRKAIEGGRDLKSAREAVGYFNLQRRR